MTSILAASSSDPVFSSAPVSATLIAVLRAVWPPRVGRMASGRSFSMTLITISGVIGSI